MKLKLYNENCLDTMRRRMPDNYVDLVVTSPPYNMNLRIRKNKYCSRQIVKEFSTKYEEFPDNLPLEKYYKLHSTILKELLRVSKIIFYNIQIVTGSKRAFFKIIGDFNENLKDIIIWDKMNAQPAMQTRLLNSQNELILIFGDNPISRQFTKAFFDRGTLSNVWKIKRGKKYGFCASFPEELVEKILLNFSSEGDIIYDPFSGTGTTQVVCKKTNRRFIGSEVSENYCKIAKARVNNLNNT